jgi:hypothetical protein
VDARRQSLAFSLAAGAAIGALALCARYAPIDLRALVAAPPTAANGNPAPASSPPTAAVETPTSPPETAALEPMPVPRAARFDADPVARAACPPDMALVEGAFCPDLAYSCLRRDGHRCAEYARGAGCRGEPDPRRYCIDRYEWPNRIGENPRVYVDWYEAKRLCGSVGKRLCRRSEWMLACEGPKRLPYPWGFVRQPSPCNIDRAAIPFDVPAMMDEATREDELARLWQADRLGAHPDCVSAFGAYDMSGNVDEWTDNLADDPSTPEPSTLNGGYWGPVRDTCRLTTTTHGPSFAFYQVGFRCCGDTIDGVAVAPPRPFVDPKRDRARAGDDAEADDPYTAD